MAPRNARLATADSSPGLFDKPGAHVDLGLTLPLFVVYHLGVVFLNIRNATDLVTGRLLELAGGDRLLYLAITCAIGAVFVGAFALLGRGEIFRPAKLVQMLVEGGLYAAAMGTGTGYIVGRLFAGPVPAAGGPFVGLVMSLGAGFYEELTFRVLLFGLGSKVLVWLFAREEVLLVHSARRPLTVRALTVMLVWALVCASVFSGVHYIGAMGDPLVLQTFVARAVLGLFLTLIYSFRGFAAAAWAHALYDVWVLVL